MTTEPVTVERALLSVSNKAGVVELARALADLGVELVASGGTGRVLAEAGLPVVQVEEVTGVPAMLDGRVKTLHPRIHGGILADRRRPAHMRQLAGQGIAPIDLVVCNLYPFEQTVAEAGGGRVAEDVALEEIDIGGPAMVRAAAKNWPSVAVVVDPADYDRIVTELRATGAVTAKRRRALALGAFRHTAAYDAAIADYLAEGEDSFLGPTLTLAARKVSDLRYGENPHQPAAFYRTGPPAGLAAAQQLHGKELSYNNLLDTDAAWRLAAELGGAAAVIVKHLNPCGVAVAPTLAEAHSRALACDRKSAFGGIVALGAPCDGPTATQIAEVFTEVVIAPGFTPDALEALTVKKSLRLLQCPAVPPLEPDIRRVTGGLLVQGPDGLDRAESARCVTQKSPTDSQWADLRLAWIVVKHVRSNAIVLVKDGAAVGVGAGQMSRVEAVELAGRRAGRSAPGTALASDAFFPFPDGLEAAAAAGATSVIQPGGSIRDDEVIACADELGIAMVFSGRRHFRH
ncbi:bifunctional phosphoribosylaminoimidazolecarboxamide formyltransferase/IMP cyclohydrolase [soil metagenome]